MDCIQTILGILIIILIIMLVLRTLPYVCDLKTDINKKIDGGFASSDALNKIISDGLGFFTVTAKKTNPVHTTATTHPKQPPKNMLIVDIANMYMGWYMEKYNQKPPYLQTDGLLRHYVECMGDHYFRFSLKNDMSKCGVAYVIKNYKFGKTAEKIPNSVIDIFNEFVRSHDNAVIAIAEDYKLHPRDKWKSPKFHYLRGRDDYLCFHLSRKYKKRFINSVIMTDDNFYDFEHFGKIPPFAASYIPPSDINDNEIVSPKPNGLGQIKDYKRIKITLEFSFDDPKSVHKIPEQGNVWTL